MSNIVENDVLMESGNSTDSTKNMYLAFVIEDEQFAVDVGHIKEIIGVEPITLVPRTEDYIKGIFNLRGDIVPAIDVRSRFRKPEIPYNQLTCIVVVFYQDYILGLIVDSILGVYIIEEDMISSPPNAKLSYSNQFVKNIGKADDGIKLLLDLEKLIFDI
ncbi:MAG: chemotaxis protein CheW [Defluviitaleaceae bacterium]|nr:chemotaxis protein CheW [Defluviitaleaceae bacterium]